MVQPRLSMQKIKEMMRLKAELSISDRLIGQAVGAARSSVQEIFRRARGVQLTWAMAQSMDEIQLHACLYKATGRPRSSVPLPDFAVVDREIARIGVTRELLWLEYKAIHPGGIGYTAFCNQYRAWRGSRDTVLRHDYVFGEKLFVDYAGQTVAIADRLGGQARIAQIFVAVLGASNYTFAEATLSQSASDWLGSHVRAFEFFGGAPRIVVPDNLRSAVSKAHRYEPDLNPAYLEFAQHYGVAVLPARVRKPRDKAKVETGVLIVTRWILARLRHHTFFSLGELNEAIAAHLISLNNRPFKKMIGSRQLLFDAQEKPALQPLPATAYSFARWKRAKVHPDYHVQVDSAYYSVPYQFIGRVLDVRISERMLELFDRGSAVASHVRSTVRWRFTTNPGHRPAAHSAVIDQSLSKLLVRAERIGPATREVIRRQAVQHKHPEQMFRSAQGIVRLAQDFSEGELEAACEQALLINLHSYRLIIRLLKTPAPKAPAASPNLDHANVRGPTYFH